MPRAKSNTKVDVIKRLTEIFPQTDPALLVKLYDSAVDAGEIDQSGNIDKWLERVEFNSVILDDKDYITALTHALRLAPNLAGTDYGTTRQRDLGQLWTDTARGFLGEIALVRFVEKHFGVKLELDYTLGPITKYLPSDIKEAKVPYGSEPIHPGIKISVKTTKFNGIWLDVPGAQIEHSDIFVLVKIGISREHFIAFLKGISFVRDKLLPKAIEIGTITEDEAKRLWDSLPESKRIPCYLPGFIDRDLMDAPPVVGYKELHYRGGKFKGYMINNYLGWVRDGIPQALPENLMNSRYEFKSIQEFSRTPHFVSSAGCLKHAPSEWKIVIERLTGKKS